MNFVFASSLALSLWQYREVFPSVDVVENEFKGREKVFVVDKNLSQEKKLHNIDPETIKFYVDKWKDKINIVKSYRLQFYNGKERANATDLWRSLSNQFPGIRFDLKYEHSNFIVLSQKYFSFIEALVIYKSIGYINVIIIHNEELY
ncbi:MAG: hypothetical protein LBD32_00775 [Cytophagales bacterium]|jgi:hypothetical protein|nr:hypothetical protein [Cytophagales bacterium]